MPIYNRGFNPVWSMVDLDGKQFDGSFYMYVLQNELPYLPAPVYHDPNGTPWTNPIPFEANGTLPVDIYWNPGQLYRLEFRKNLGLLPPSQNDPLIYEINNYMAGSGGDGPVDTVGLFTDNQMTNSQFSLVSFSSPLVLANVTNPAPIEVAPGWFLELTGTGNVTLERIALNNTLANPSNAPYALRILLSGSWNASPTLRQRFHQNGMLWSGKYVSSSVTARIQGAPQAISARLVSSAGVPLVEVLRSRPITDSFTEESDYGLVPATTNANTPPNAYIDYQLLLPTDVDIYVTSLQVIASDIPIAFPYEEDTIDRQIDHTWHYYKDDVLLKPKDSLLVGWNFPLNPWQFSAQTITTVAANGYYADQTMVACENVNTLATSRLSDGRFQINAVAASTQGKFGLFQYIDASSVLPYWQAMLSSIARMQFTTTNGSTLKLKMRLLYRANTPTALTPVATWNAAGVDPTFAAGWTAVAPINDPVFTIGSALTDYPFEGMQMPTLPGAGSMIALFLYTDSAMSSAGTPDAVSFQQISLVPGRFASEANVQTFEQCLAQCQFYYESTYNPGVLPGTVTPGGIIVQQGADTVTGPPNVVNGFATAFGVRFNTVKRTSPVIVTYSPNTLNASNTVRMIIYSNGAVQNSADVTFNAAAWAYNINDRKGFGAASISPATLVTISGPVQPINRAFSEINFHYSASALLGIVP